MINVRTKCGMTRVRARSPDQPNALLSSQLIITGMVAGSACHQAIESSIVVKNENAQTKWHDRIGMGYDQMANLEIVMNALRPFEKERALLKNVWHLICNQHTFAQQ